MMTDSTSTTSTTRTTSEADETRNTVATSKTEWTRDAEWRRAEIDEHSQQPTEWCRLTREDSSVPVVLSRWGTVWLIDQFARNLIDSGIRYADVIEPHQDPTAALTWDYLTDVQSDYFHDLVEVLRLPDESLAAFIHALAETAAAMGAEWLQRSISGWASLVAAWPIPDPSRSPSAAQQVSNALLLPIAARWGIAGNPTPAQAEAVNLQTIVNEAVEYLTREDCLDLIRILVTAAEELGVAALRSTTRQSLHSTRVTPEKALMHEDTFDLPPF